MKKAKINEYNAKGAPTSEEAMKEKGTFKKGGKVKAFKHGGCVKGEKSAARLDKPARRASGGKTPFSVAEKVKTEATDAGDGKAETPLLKQSVYAKGGKISGLSSFHSNKASKHHGG